MFDESLALWRELGDRTAVARCLSNLANVVKLEGDHARARSLYAECLAIFNELGDRTGIAWSMNHQGDVACGQGDYSGARALYEQSLVIFRELGDKWGVAGTLADMGNLAREEGDCSTARSLYQESIKHFYELDHKRGIARLLECFACAASDQLEAERSLRLAGCRGGLTAKYRSSAHASRTGKTGSKPEPGTSGFEQYRGDDSLAGRLVTAVRESGRGSNRDGGRVSLALARARQLECVSSRTWAPHLSGENSKLTPRSWHRSSVAPRKLDWRERPGAGRVPGSWFRRERGKRSTPCRR